VADTVTGPSGRASKPITVRDIGPDHGLRTPAILRTCPALGRRKPPSRACWNGPSKRSGTTMRPVPACLRASTDGP